MFDRLLNAWAYWDWFLIRQGVKGGNNRVQRSFAQGALSTIVPAIGLVPIMVIIFRTVGMSLSKSSKAIIFWGVLAFVFILALEGSRRGKQKREEFEKYDKKKVEKCDRYIWVFTLSCVASFVMMLVVL